MEPSISHLGVDAVQEQKSRAKSCTECRQVKLKCDFKERAPQSCSRCSRRGLDCRKDASFKRVPARSRRGTGSVSPGPRGSSQPPSQLSAALSSRPSTASMNYSQPPTRQPSITQYSISSQSSGSYSQQASATGDTPYLSTLHPAFDFNERVQQHRFLQLRSASEDETWRLGEIVLQSNTAIAIFQHFDQYLLEHVPFLEPCYSLSELYNQSSLLFWTIISVSSRIHPNCAELYEKLSTHYETHLYSQLFLGGPSIKKVHAILILCQWPFPVPSQEHDASFNLCGSAINTAMTLDLHKTKRSQEHLDLTPRVESSSYVRNMTWLACFQLGTSMSSFFNLPPPVTSASGLKAISELCRDEDLPGAFRAKAIVQHRLARLVSTLDSGLDSNTSNSLLQLFEHDLVQIRKDFSQVWSPNVEIDALSATLYAHGLSFVHSPDPAATLASAAHILQRCLDICISLVNTIAQFDPASKARADAAISPYPTNQAPLASPTAINAPPATSNLPRFANSLRIHPKPFLRYLASAAYFLLFYISTPLPPTTTPALSSPISTSSPTPASSAPRPTPSLFTDREVARAHLAYLTRLMISFPNAEHVRVAKSIEIKSRYADQAAGKTPVQFTSRLGARILSAFEATGSVLRAAADAAAASGLHPGHNNGVGVPDDTTGGMMQLGLGYDAGTAWHPSEEEAMQTMQAMIGMEQGLGGLGYGLEEPLPVQPDLMGWNMEHDPWSGMGYLDGGGSGGMGS